MIFFWPKVYGPLGKTPYIYPRYQVWGVTDLNFDLAYYHPPLLGGFSLCRGPDPTLQPGESGHATPRFEYFQPHLHHREL